MNQEAGSRKLIASDIITAPLCALCSSAYFARTLGLPFLFAWYAKHLKARCIIRRDPVYRA